MQLNPNYDGVLFDLDGTILDTVTDICFALNQVRREFDLPDLAIDSVRNIVSDGSKAMMKLAFNVDEHDSRYKMLREKFLSLYDTHLADNTQFFPGMQAVLAHLETVNMPWGIVTNKLTKQTLPLLNALNLAERTDCIVCGDTLSTYKPDPAPIHHACTMLKVKPQRTLFIGDSINDVLASKAAGSKAIVALYGYIAHNTDPYTWHADGYIKSPSDIIALLEKDE